MKNSRRLARLSLGKAIALVCAGCAGYLIGPALAQGNDLAFLDTLQKGQWELRYRDGSPARKLCVKTGREFIQLGHAGAQCGRYLVDNAGGKLTVQYSCKGDGYGRTSIRRETSALIQVEGQGVAGGSPYQFTAEARRTGPC